MSEDLEILNKYKAENYPSEFRIQLLLDVSSIMGMEMDGFEYLFKDPKFAHVIKEHRSPQGWRKIAYEKLLTTVLKPIADLQVEDKSSEEAIGFISGILVAAFESDQEEAKELPILIKALNKLLRSFSKTPVIRKKDLRGTIVKFGNLLSLDRYTEFFKGYSDGLSFSQQFKVTLDYEGLSTRIYYTLLYCSEYVDYLDSRPKTIDFLRKLYPEELKDTLDESINLRLKWIGLHAREKRGRPPVKDISI